MADKMAHALFSKRGLQEVSAQIQAPCNLKTHPTASQILHIRWAAAYVHTDTEILHPYTTW